MTNNAITAQAADLNSAEKNFLGHPRGLAYLAVTEAWERFSFYGMKALLIIYMVQELLLPGHIENVVGMAAFRNAVESITGTLSTQAFASQVFGLYSGLVYFTPLIGGLIADRWLGAKKTVMLGIILMTLGHFSMAFEVSVLIGLSLLVLGSGCLKGNIAAQVGHLYARTDETLRTRGFTIFSTAINIGAVTGPIVCGLLAQMYGWDIGFGVAGIFMIVAAVVYFSGMRYFISEQLNIKSGGMQAAMTKSEHQLLAIIGIILVITLFQWFAYSQIFNVGLIWVAEKVDLVTPFGTMPVPWFNSLYALAAILIVPFLVILWRTQANRGTEPGELGKIGIGAVVMSMSMVTLAFGSWQAGTGQVSVIFPLFAFVLCGVAFMWTWPTSLALVSRHAPAKINALAMAVVYLLGFVSGVGSGYIAGFYESMGATAFWIMNALISLSGGIVVILFGSTLKRAINRFDSKFIIQTQDKT
ncbi:MAG: peptide MFS transporter [bacterium]